MSRSNDASVVRERERQHAVVDLSDVDTDLAEGIGDPAGLVPELDGRVRGRVGRLDSTAEGRGDHVVGRIPRLVRTRGLPCPDQIRRPFVGLVVAVAARNEQQRATASTATAAPGVVTQFVRSQFAVRSSTPYLKDAATST